RLARTSGMASRFDFNDFRRQITQLQMGLVRDADGEILRIQGIIDSMTPNERSNPQIIDRSRRQRIAVGAGVAPSDVSGLVKQFDGMAAVVEQMRRKRW